MELFGDYDLEGRLGLERALGMSLYHRTIDDIMITLLSAEQSMFTQSTSRISEYLHHSTVALLPYKIILRHPSDIS